MKNFKNISLEQLQSINGGSSSNSIAKNITGTNGILTYIKNKFFG